MARKNVATENAEQTANKPRNSIKDKARAHITRLENRRVTPTQYGMVLEAFAAVGLIKYDEALEKTDRYTSDYIVDYDRGDE